MEDLIIRMIRCGIPEKTARIVYVDFVTRGRWRDLIMYVRSEEMAHELARV